MTAAPLLLFTLAVLGLQIGLHKQVLQLGQHTPRGEPLQLRSELGGCRCSLLFAAVVVPLPLGALVVQSSSVATYGLAATRGTRRLTRGSK